MSALASLQAAMRALPFVEWDRTAGDDYYRMVFGWIDRPDGARDFVVLQTFSDWDGHVHPFTSSAKYTKEISRRLSGCGFGHVDCERVSEVFQ